MAQPNSVNLSHASTGKKTLTNRLGNNFFSIDFEMNESLSNKEIEDRNKKPVIGTLLVGNRKIPLTFSEMSKIEETIFNAKHTFLQRHRLGFYKD